MNGIIYIRVSSGAQIEGTSLDHQDEACRKYCAEHNIEVKKVFREEGESAKTADRTELLRALEYCRKHRKTLDAFVVYKLDRFARLTEDHFAIKKILNQHGVQLHSAVEPIGEKPEERFIETVLAGAAEYDNAVRRQRAIDGMSAKINQGIYPRKPPLGYACSYSKRQGKKKTLPDKYDPETFAILQIGLREFSLGLLTKIELARRLDELGLEAVTGRKTTAQAVDKLLAPNRLKFYAGLIWNPWTKKDVTGLHRPILTKEEHEAIRRILAGRKQNKKKLTHNPRFPLKRTVKCGACSAFLTGSSPRGNGGVYAYYHCFKRSCARYARHLRADDVEVAFFDYLKQLVPEPERLPVFKETLRRCWEANRGSSKEQLESLRRRLAALEDRRRRIYEMREDGAYSRAEFEDRRLILEHKVDQTRVQLAQGSQACTLDGFLDYALETLACLPDRLKEYSAELRHRFQKLLFPHGIEYLQSSGFRTPKLSLVFNVFDTLDASKYPLVPQRSAKQNESVDPPSVDDADWPEIDWLKLEEELKIWKALTLQARAETAAKQA